LGIDREMGTKRENKRERERKKKPNKRLKLAEENMT
jgi:hypothetical protein